MHDASCGSTHWFFMRHLRSLNRAALHVAQVLHAAISGHPVSTNEVEVPSFRQAPV